MCILGCKYPANQDTLNNYSNKIIYNLKNLNVVNEWNYQILLLGKEN